MVRAHLIVTFVMIVVMAGTLTSAQDKPQDIITVLTTSPALESVIKAIGGDKVAVESIIPDGVEPHDYEPPEQELIELLRTADVVFMTGPSHLPLEERIEGLKRQGFIEAEIVNYHDYLGHGLRLLENPKTGLPNPHGYLFSPSGMVAVARTAASVFSKLDPGNADYYRCRLESFLAWVNRSMSASKEIVPKNAIVGIASPVLQYVLNDLGVEVKYVLLADVSTEPTEADLNKLREMYGSGELNAFLISDMIASKNPKIMRLLESEGIPYSVVPVSTLISKPEFIMVSVATSISNVRPAEVIKPQLSTSLLLAGVVSEALVIVGLVYLIYRWKKVVIDALVR